ncbi:hypothetical protein [Cupriavidus necator]|uniref:hypothetical protein n=1 Tax=Cupriavidus necator TaxID=106590 RepID=UPI0005B3F28B|nr:hypothetical protein [Cupriavidus necator]
MQNIMLLTLATLAVNCGSSGPVELESRFDPHLAKPQVLRPVFKPCMQDDGKNGAALCYPVLTIKHRTVDKDKR